MQLIKPSLFALSLLTITLQTGCSSCIVGCMLPNAEPLQEIVETPHTHSQGYQSDIGVNFLYEQTDVAHVPAHYAHVLNPNWDQSAQNIYTQFGTQQKQARTVPIASRPITMHSTKATLDPDSIWRRFCNKEELTSSEWTYVNTHQVPQHYVSNGRFCYGLK